MDLRKQLIEDFKIEFKNNGFPEPNDGITLIFDCGVETIFFLIQKHKDRLNDDNFNKRFINFELELKYFLFPQIMFKHQEFENFFEDKFQILLDKMNEVEKIPDDRASLMKDVFYRGAFRSLIYLKQNPKTFFDYVFKN